MDRDQNREQEPRGEHPQVWEHPEQRRQDETGHEDPTDPREIGEPPSERGNRTEPERAA
jgi:hypothetical protein